MMEVDKGLQRLYHLVMRAKFIILFMLFVGLCNAQLVRLVSVSGEVVGEFQLDRQVQSEGDMYAQCMTFANKIINGGLDQPSGYPLIRKHFHLASPTGEILQPPYFGTIEDGTSVDLTLVKAHKEIMVLPLGNKDNNVTIVFRPHGDKFVAEKLPYNIGEYYSVEEKTFENVTRLSVALL